MELQFTTQVFKESAMFVAHSSELDISSCGDTEQKALENLKEAVTLFLEEADKLGTVNQILQEAGFVKRNDKLEGPQFVSTTRISLPLPLLHVTEA
jgi:predicted RNase H-like HicB family nuclease